MQNFNLKLNNYTIISFNTYYINAFSDGNILKIFNSYEYITFFIF